MTKIMMKIEKEEIYIDGELKRKLYRISRNVNVGSGDPNWERFLDLDESEACELHKKLGELLTERV